ncbi:hypothetical protein SKAU_G00339510 [Synaphobranchus kaupii]|uniref:Uncharacterized protein n=1 Tax=Synaphobranchus kaupii TaxID=118154 RepID=A0A9Q1EMN3_SYNKA|nr:hypothetical protein SKAU_G00339510 [Synaphobranchus kaupii]
MCISVKGGDKNNSYGRMSTRRKKRRQKQAVQGCRDGKDGQRSTGCVDRLAFKYMEMCKVESSTDSESDTSPRWSDTSTKGCVSSTPESQTARKTLTFVPKPGRYQLPSLDPYDGSSEDSGSSKCGPKGQRQGGCRMRSRGRRGTVNTATFSRDMGKCGAQASTPAAPAPDIQMRSLSDSEIRTVDLSLLSPRGHKEHMKEMTIDSGMHTESSLCTPGVFSYVGVTPVRLPESPSHRSQTGSHRLHPKSPNSPTPLKSLPKRKSCFPGAEAGERGLRKRQCVVEMEVGHFPL